jgi:methionine-R-sulfoxide reductase
MKKFPSFIILCLLIVFSFNSCAQKNSLPKPSKKPEINLSEKEWKAKLSPEQYYILREKGTERAFSGEFVFTKEKGTYKCAGCGEPLFTDDMKFESECGWPSFDKEIEGGKIIQTKDLSHNMKRIEITCAKCGGHLGHIFDDGPTKTGQRYCVNSLSLSFEPQKKEAKK